MPDCLPKPAPVLGAAFSIPDLMLAQAWAGATRRCLSIHLDRPVAGIPCEEVLAFCPLQSSPGNGAAHLQIWRAGAGVICQFQATAPVWHPSLWDCLNSLPRG